ncbi:hypothetical protein [Streptomyces chrestomyceticus]|uniref:hypothetical protein n=1 Tax=Streptomyces chrestomyceticus TaxID=68185 RepID=UPI0037BD0674
MSPRLASLSHRRSPSESPAADRTGPAMFVGLVFAICLVAANLRASLTGVGTHLPTIERDSGLAPSWGGLPSTFPLLTFAATSPLVARASHRFGAACLLASGISAPLSHTLPGSGHTALTSSSR